MLFLRFQDVFEQLAADIVAHLLAVGDGVLQRWVGVQFQLEIAGERLLDVLAYHQLAQVLQVGQPLEKQNPLDQLVGVLHFVDGFVMLVLRQLVETPVLEHLGVQEILVDGGELVDERRVEMLNDFLVAFHVPLLITKFRRKDNTLNSAKPASARVSGVVTRMRMMLATD